MRFSVGFIFTALALSVSAFPIGPVTAPKGMAIPISKHISAMNIDGTANLELLRTATKASMNKIALGFEAYERNTGKPHSLALHLVSKRATGADPLTGYHRSLWYGSISVGTPAKDFTVDFDTGSSDLFLPGPSCAANCDKHARYDPSTSSSSKPVGKPFSLSYGDGSTVSGDQYTDTVQISGLSATSQTLGEASQYSTGFRYSNFPADGLMGMAYKSISDYNADPLFQSLVAQGKTTESIFAFKLASMGSELFIGGTNRLLYTGDFTYTPVTDQGYWQVNMDSLTVNGQSVVSSVAAIIDTGTTLIVGSTNAVRAFYANIPGSKDASATIGDGVYTLPCNAMPNVSLTFGGKSWNIAPKLFNLGRVSRGSNDCVGGIGASDAAENMWIVGDVFLSNVYTAFDLEHNTVGFAQLSMNQIVT